MPETRESDRLSGAGSPRPCQHEKAAVKDRPPEPGVSGPPDEREAIAALWTSLISLGAVWDNVSPDLTWLRFRGEIARDERGMLLEYKRQVKRMRRQYGLP